MLIWKRPLVSELPLIPEELPREVTELAEVEKVSEPRFPEIFFGLRVSQKIFQKIFQHFEITFDIIYLVCSHCTY